MTRLISSLLVVVLAILAMAIPAEAQSGRSRARSITRAIAGTDRYRGGYDGYGVYDPYGPRDGRDIYGRKLPPIEIEECEYVECYGRKGTFHSEMGLTHFRMNDSTHNPFNMNHKNCIVIKSIGQTATQSSAQQAPSEVPAEVVSGPQAVAGPVVGRDENRGPAYRSGPHPVTNASRVFIDVYDGDKKPENLVGTLDSGESFDLARPRNRYRVWAQIPRNGSFDEEELHEETKSANTKGWTFVEPTTAQEGK